MLTVNTSSQYGNAETRNMPEGIAPCPLSKGGRSDLINYLSLRGFGIVDLDQSRNAYSTHWNQLPQSGTAPLPTRNHQPQDQIHGSYTSLGNMLFSTARLVGAEGAPNGDGRYRRTI